MRERSAATTAEVCSRCHVTMELQPFYEGSEDNCWYCPCCKSKLQTVPMLEAKFARRMAAPGMTEEEYDAHVRSQINTDPLSPEELEGLRRHVAQLEADYEPPCEHVKNPWSADA